jgi:hypothetical protein
MAKKLYADGNNGTVAICEPDADIYNPLSNLNKIYFHSDLNYLRIIAIINISIDLPYRAADGSDYSSAYGTDIRNVYSHNLGYVPIIMACFKSPAEINKQPYIGEFPLQTGGNCSLRTLILGADENYIYSREMYLNKDVSFSSITVNTDIFLMDEV